MPRLRDVINDWKEKNARPPLRKWPCIAGDGNGVVIDPDREHYVFVRMPDSQVASAYNTTVPIAYNDLVWCGYDDINVLLFQVLGLRSAYGVAGLTPARLGIGLHGATHRYLGIDTTTIDGGQFTPGLIVPLGTMTVFLPEVYYRTAGGVIRFDAAISADLTADIPATSGHALWVNVSVNPSTFLAEYTVGAEFVVAFATDQTIFFPDPPLSNVSLGDILLRWDTTEIDQAAIDCRRRSYFIGGGATVEEALIRELIFFG
jgi:hypothetical protein